ncbi:hypothetical protein [Microvirga pudoricolor]|uniref:hypothetical protein n=1 Tax=Microvirga pudoricolor TaxID=2778729 RepID=UPI00194DF826|nr:hypothetical protein [Microvirga pudoricolor]MBM6594400.1 hypothetical protein [Microvirga pudoricolor]
MSTAENKIPVAAPVAGPDIQGRLDAVDGRRLYGWVWDRTQPQERLLVRVLFRGRTISSTTADRPRIDLRRNGIGDGGYAFEVELPEAAAAEPEGLEVVAVSRSTGEEVVLPVPSQNERVTEAAINAPLSRVMDQLEVLIAAQRRSQFILREAAELMRGTAEQVEKMSSKEDGIGAALDVTRAGQGELAQRIADIEVFLMRFDRMIAGFDDRIKDLTKTADRPMRRAVGLIVALTVISAASAVSTLAIALR